MITGEVSIDREEIKNLIFLNTKTPHGTNC